jgi:hypothetical protein
MFAYNLAFWGFEGQAPDRYWPMEPKVRRGASAPRCARARAPAALPRRRRRRRSRFLRSRAQPFQSSRRRRTASHRTTAGPPERTSPPLSAAAPHKCSLHHRFGNIEGSKQIYFDYSSRLEGN